MNDESIFEDMTLPENVKTPTVKLTIDGEEIPCKVSKVGYLKDAIEYRVTFRTYSEKEKPVGYPHVYKVLLYQDIDSFEVIVKKKRK